MTALFHRLFYYVTIFWYSVQFIIGEHEYVKVIPVLHVFFFPFIQLKEKDILFQKNSLSLKLEIFTQKY